MKRMKLLVVVALAVAICLPGMAGATSVVAGGPSASDWGLYGWGYDNYPGGGYPSDPITKIEAYISGGGITFDVSGTGIIATPYDPNSFTGWTGARLSATHAQVTKDSGTGTGVNYDYKFTDPNPGTAWSLDWNAYNGTTFVLHEHIEGLGSAVTNNGGLGAYSKTEYTPVPLPPSVLLLGSGILGLVGLGWRRRKNS